MRGYLAAVLSFAAFGAAPPAHAVEAFDTWYQGRPITVVDRDGWALYQGDIIIGRTEEVRARALSGGPTGDRIGALEKSVTLGGASGRWLKNASGVFELPYEVESDPDGSVPGAVAIFNQQLAGFMQAVPHTTQTDYVAFTLSATDNGGACSSSVGRKGGRQVIQGSHLCGAGTLVHEMGHAVGLWHEQEHDDRDLYVTLDLNVVEPDSVYNFAQTPGQRSATPYDYASIMHYGATSFSRNGLASMETIPPGIGIGQRAQYSAGDLEAIHRLYGAPPQQVTVASLPSGLSLVVDGNTVTTPATFNWSIGSTHTLDVPSGVQVVNGVANFFGRWNIDRNGDLQARRTITVAAGDGTITAPASAPAISTYTASFVRYKEVRLTTSGGSTTAGGSVNATPAPQPLPGVSGTFYRDRQAFSLEAAPNPGSVFAGWGGSYFFSGAMTTSFRNPFRGPAPINDQLQTAYEYRATFTDHALLTLRAQSEEGEALPLSATVTPSGGTAASQRMPYNATAWTPGQSGTVSASTASTSPLTATMRYTFRDWDGDPSATVTVSAPAAGQPAKVVTAHFTKEYQAFKQVIPACAATMTIPAGNGGWYQHGSALPVTLSAASGWVFVGWEGSLSGTSMTPSLAVNDYPNLIARFNTVPVALAVTSVSPGIANSGGPTAITITGTGFTSGSEVYVNGIREPSQFVSGTQLTATVPLGDLPTAGIALVTVANRVGTGACTVAANGELDVKGALALGDVSPQTGWWWNPNEGGRGFFIEKRNNNLFMAGYLYETDGRATWFSAAGAMNGSTFFGGMTTFRGGQTLTGSYIAPSNGPIPGNVQLNFTAADRATLVWPGGTTQLQRFGFGSGTAGVGENGWWWNAAESGRGFSIEQQGNQLFLAGFMYDASGNPVWYAAQGTVTNGTYAGNLVQYANGQTLTGAYQPAVVSNSNVGAITLSFTGSQSANLTLPGGRVVPLTRFAF